MCDDETPAPDAPTPDALLLDLAQLARALGAAAADLLPAGAPPEPLPVLCEQAERLFVTLLEKGDRETVLRLNPFLALLVEAAAKGR